MTSFPEKPKNFFALERDLNEEWYRKYSTSKALAIDTETMGLVHGRDRLCLIQICDESDNVICIKIAKGQTESPYIKDLLENNAIEKVFHFARFDVAALSSGLNISVQNIFCTKIASKIARTYTPRHGLKDLVMDLVGIELDKKSQCSDWGRVDELTDCQLAYAGNDVRFLLSAKNRLKKMLAREERLELANRCFKCIPVLADLDRLKFNQIFEH